MNKREKVLIIDGQGGRIGAQIIMGLKAKNITCDLIAIGTNGIATAAMLKAGATNGATGENAVIVNARNADLIIGPVGIVIADSLLGEITPKMAVAVGQSNAKKLLIPINQCNNMIVGIDDLKITHMIEEIMTYISNYFEKV